MKAIWNGTVIAESDDTVVVEGNHYFPADSVDRDVLRPSDTHTRLPVEGHRVVLDPRGRRPGQPRRRLVLPRAQGCRGADPRPGRLLEGRHRRARERPGQIAKSAMKIAKSSGTPNTTSRTWNGTQSRWVTFQP